MIALLGKAGVLFALAAAVWLAIQGVRVARRADAGNDASSLRIPAAGLIGGAVVAFLAIEIGLLSNDFTLEYVASNHARSTPLPFTIASGWAALEGSIVLWGLVLGGFTWLLARRIGDDDGLGAGALAVMGAVAVFWFGMMATVADPFRVCTEIVNGACAVATSNPFAAAVAPLDGVGANPLLQNHILMAVHPPMLYLGYVGLTVPFAFALSALARGEPGSRWLERTHRWTLVAWVFLTAGIILGAWWSYEVLGWGGYWAWDPVENAAFLPWLAATAFIHSAVVQRRRGMLQAWNLVLVIGTFALTILGTFLTRSGVIASVHSFTQSAVGPTILGFLIVVLVGSLALFAMRAHLVASSPRLESLASREGVFLLNNLLLALFAFAVLIGTLYPLILEAFTGDTVSVGRPFFDRVTVPIAFVLLLAMGLGPVTPYRVARGSVVWERIRTPIRVALVAGGLGVLAGVRSIGLVAVIVLAAFVIATIGRHYAHRVRTEADAGTPRRRAAWSLMRRDPGFWGGQIAHLGVALVAIAIAVTTAQAVRTEVSLGLGQTVEVAGQCLTYDGPFLRTEPHRQVEGARILVREAGCGDVAAVMEPRVHRYPNFRQPVATPDVRTTFSDDLYLSLAGVTGETVLLDVFVFPYAWLLWIGGFVVVAGGAFALTGRRRRERPIVAPSSEQLGSSRSA